MAGPILLMKAALVGAILGLVAPHVLILWVIEDEYRSLLKDDIGLPQAVRLFPKYVLHEYRTRLEWSALPAYTAKAVAIGAAAATLLTIFGVGLVEVFG